MFYYLVRYQRKHGADGVVNSDDWHYNVVIVKTVVECPEVLA